MQYFFAKPTNEIVAWAIYGLTWCCLSPPGGAAAGTPEGGWAHPPGSKPAQRAPASGDACWDSGCGPFGSSGASPRSPALTPRRFVCVWEGRVGVMEKIHINVKITQRVIHFDLEYICLANTVLGCSCYTTTNVSITIGGYISPMYPT